MSKRFSLLTILILVAGTALAACGGGGGDDNSADGLKSAAKKATEKAFGKDAKASDLRDSFSKRCKDMVNEDQANQALAAIKAFAGDNKIKVESVEVQNVANNKGEALVRVSGIPDPDPGFDPWVFEDGKWLSDDC
jgi:ABC-type glycerol-3-phosphate transport system substrate-binding protein